MELPASIVARRKISREMGAATFLTTQRRAGDEPGHRHEVKVPPRFTIGRRLAHPGLFGEVGALEVA